MGTVTTTYDVITRYMAENRAGPAVQQMTTQVQNLERATTSTMGILGRVGAVFAGYLGFQQANRSLITFNSTMEQSKIQMAGLMAQAGRGDYTSNLEKASLLVKQMQLDARASVGTTADFVQMASMLVQPLTMAGASMENIRDMTKGAVVASRSMGVESMVAARDVDQAIRGMYRSVDVLSSKLLTPMGYGGEEGRRKYNLLSMQERLRIYQQALASPAVAAMAKGQEFSFAGVASTFQDTLQMTLGKVGMPLFKGITAELRRWNEWLDRNQTLVDHLADVLGNKILQAAVSFKNAIQWAAEHWKTIAASYATIKAAGYLAGGTAGLLGGAAAGAGGAGAFGQKVATVSLIASAVYIGGVELARWIDNRQSEQINRGATVGRATLDLYQGALTDSGQARAFKQMLTSSGLATGQGLNKEAFASAVNADQWQRIRWANALGMQNPHEATPELIAEKMATKFAGILKDEMVNGQLNTDALGGFYGAALERSLLPKIEKPKINVTINRIEVASNDPDRFVFGFARALGDALKNPSGIGPALHALREG